MTQVLLSPLAGGRHQEEGEEREQGECRQADNRRSVVYTILSNRNKVRDKFGITYFEKLITMQIRSRD